MFAGRAPRRRRACPRSSGRPTPRSGRGRAASPARGRGGRSRPRSAGRPVRPPRRPDRDRASARRRRRPGAPAPRPACAHGAPGRPRSRAGTPRRASARARSRRGPYLPRAAGPARGTSASCHPRTAPPAGAIARGPRSVPVRVGVRETPSEGDPSDVRHEPRGAGRAPHARPRAALDAIRNRAFASLRIATNSATARSPTASRASGPTSSTCPCSARAGRPSPTTCAGAAGSASTGACSWREWETSEEQKRQSVSISADRVQFLDSAGERDGGGGRAGRSGRGRRAARGSERRAGGPRGRGRARVLTRRCAAPARSA